MAFWSIIGTGIDGGAQGRSFGVTLDTNLSTWIAGGPSVDLFFISKRGHFEMAGIPESGTQIINSSLDEVAFFTYLLGSSAVGSSGVGRASEKGVNFSWRLDTK